MDLIDIYTRKEKVDFLQVYNRLPIIIKSAKGCVIVDEDGKEYRDFIAGIAVNVLGHSHPSVVKAATEQITKYMHVSNYFYQEVQIKFVAKLKQLSGYDRVFLANSGTETIEAALKLCRAWGYEKDKTEIIAFNNGFHGRTYGALSLMNKENYKKNMGPYLPNITTIDYNDIDELQKAVNEKTAGIFIEFIQGEGGMQSVTSEFIHKINELKTKFNFLVIADEVQTGVGRTGKFLASEYWNIKPDITTIAKGIGGGLPLGVLLASKIFANVWSKGQHGSTFGGNPVACAAGYAVLEELDRGVLRKSETVGKFFHEQLALLHEEFPNKVLEVRGKGLMIGLELDFDASFLAHKLLNEQNIIVNSTASATNVLRILPPLIITKEDVEYFISAIKHSLEG